MANIGKFAAAMKKHMAKISESADKRDSSHAQTSAHTVCAIASDGTHHDVPTCATKHGTSQRTIKRAVSAHAYAVVQTFLLVMEVAIAELKQARPRWVTAVPQWDETKGKHKFYLDKKSNTDR